jgi:hypothetical protein
MPALQGSSTDDLLKAALLTILQKPGGRKKSLPGLDPESDDEKGDLGAMSGARHTIALEKLHSSMRKHPEMYADRMEALAAGVLGASVQSDVAVQYAHQMPMGRQKTLGYMTMKMAYIHQAAKEDDVDKVRFLSMAGLSMAEQF